MAGLCDHPARHHDTVFIGGDRYQPAGHPLRTDPQGRKAECAALLQGRICFTETLLYTRRIRRCPVPFSVGAYSGLRRFDLSDAEPLYPEIYHLGHLLDSDVSHPRDHRCCAVAVLRRHLHVHSARNPAGWYEDEGFGAQLGTSCQKELEKLSQKYHRIRSAVRGSARLAARTSRAGLMDQIADPDGGKRESDRITGADADPPVPDVVHCRAVHAELRFEAHHALQSLSE